MPDFDNYGSTAMRVWEKLKEYANSKSIFSILMKVTEPPETEYSHEVTIGTADEFEDVILSLEDVDVLTLGDNWEYDETTGILTWTGDDVIMKHNGGATVQHSSSTTAIVHLGLRQNETLVSEGAVDTRLDNKADISVTTFLSVSTGDEFKIVCMADTTGTVTLYHVRASMETLATLTY